MSVQEMVSHIDPSNKENLQKFSWKEYLILAFAGLIGSVASIPSVWPYIEETASRTTIPI